MKTMKVSEARESFARALLSVVRDDEPLIIVRYSKPFAAIVPINRLPSVERTITKHDQKDGRRRRR